MNSINMKQKAFIFLPIVVLLILTTSYTLENPNAHDENITKHQLLIEMVIDGLQKNHFAPPDLNDDYSKKAYSQYLNKLDHNKRYLIEADIDKLNKYELLLDDQIKNSELSFFKLSYNLINTRIEEVKSFYKEILDKPFDFTLNEFYELDSKKKKFPKTIVEKKEEWRKALKYATLSRLADKLKEQEQAIEENDTSFVIKSFEELEEATRK